MQCFTSQTFKLYSIRQKILCCANKHQCTQSHKHIQTHTHSHSRGQSNLPGRLVSDWMSDAGDSCTHHSFYEYITFYVHPNTDLSSSENQRGQTFTHQSSGKLELSETSCKTNICSQNTCKSFSWAVIQTSSLTERVCRCLCPYFFWAEMAYEISKCVICCMKLHNIKDFPPLPQEPKNIWVFLRVQTSPVFRLSIAQKAKASNETRY